MIRFSQFIKENANATLADKAKKSGFSLGILKQVYKRGMAAWKVGHKPGTTPQQWGMARVNSFITGGRTRVKGDPDLWAKQKGNIKKPKKESVGEDMTPLAKRKTMAIMRKKPNPINITRTGIKKAAKDITSQKEDVAAVKQNKPLQNKLDKLYGPKEKKPVRKEDAAADKARADFFKRGGKITKLPPGKAAGYHGKDDPGKDMHGMMAKGDTKDFKKNKFVGSMK